MRGPVNIHVLALVDCTPIVPVGVVDLLRKTVRFTEALVPPRKQRELVVHLVGPGKRSLVRCSGGITLRCDKNIKDVSRSDLVVVPALDPDVVDHIAMNHEAVVWIRRMYERGADVASACSRSRSGVHIGWGDVVPESH